MYLFNIDVHHFRGIKELSLRLGATTVLIGENDWGKASLFEFLERCLGHAQDSDPVFTADDLHIVAGSKSQPAEIGMRFRESDTGEFDKPELKLLADHSEESGQRRSVLLSLEITPGAGSDEPLELKVMIGADKTNTGVEILQLMRRYCPVLIIRPDRPTTRSEDDTETTSDPDRHRIEQQIEKVYDTLVSAQRPATPHQVDEAIADVGKLLHDHALQSLAPNPRTGELLKHLQNVPRTLALGGGPALPIGTHGSSTQRISLLVLVGAILHACGPRALDPEAMPLVVIEEPEAHLHPMMLAGIWALIESMQTQRLVTTYSGALLARVPLHQLRRIQRTSTGSSVARVRRNSLDADDRRRVGYHIRALRGVVLFARVWILIEGETEFWLLPELARILGHDFQAEGIQMIEFAQCGVAPLAKLANDLDIKWNLLTDGDDAGATYIRQAQQFVEPEEVDRRLLRFKERDIEHHLWEHGFAPVYREASGRGSKARKTEQPTSVIDAAIRAHSKPDLALRVIERAEQMERSELSPVLTKFIEAAVASARAAHTPPGE